MADFRDICWDIFLDHVKIVTACSDNSSKFTALHAHSIATVLDFHVIGDTNFSLMNWGNTYLASFYFLHLWFSLQNSQK